MTGVCINPWAEEDRKYYSEIAREILGDYYSSLLLQDEIPSTAYDVIVDTIKTSLEFTKKFRDDNALHIAREVRYAFEEGDFKEDDKLWIGLDKDEMEWIKDFAKKEDKLKLLEHLEKFLNNFKCKL